MFAEQLMSIGIKFDSWGADIANGRFPWERSLKDSCFGRYAEEERSVPFASYGEIISSNMSVPFHSRFYKLVRELLIIYAPQ